MVAALVRMEVNEDLRQTYTQSRYLRPTGELRGKHAETIVILRPASQHISGLVDPILVEADVREALAYLPLVLPFVFRCSFPIARMLIRRNRRDIQKSSCRSDM